jgi:hypothetical protein
VAESVVDPAALTGVDGGAREVDLVGVAPQCPVELGVLGLDQHSPFAVRRGGLADTSSYIE